MASEIKVNKISPESGTTLTLGDSGDTINFGSGVLPNFENLTVTGDLTVDTNSLKVDSANNFVGIGTASPSVALDVVGAITATGNITGTLATAAQPNITSVGTLTSFTSTGIDDNATSTAIQLNSNQHVILYGGQIQKTNNTSSITYSGGSNSNAGANLTLFGGSHATTPNVARFRSNATEVMRITSAGNVGIGTSSPNGKLQLVPSAVDTAIFSIRRQDHASTNLFEIFQDSNMVGGTGGAHLTTNNRPFAITTDPSSTLGNGLFIDIYGNVGIGNTNPADFSGAGGQNLVVGSGSGAEGMTIYSGTTSDGVLGFADGYSGTEDYRGFLIYKHNGDAFQFGTSSSERMRLNSTGLGIGTTSPTDILDIRKSTSTSYDASSVQSGGARLSIFNTNNTLSDTFADIHFKCHSTSSGEARIGMELTSVSNSDLFFITENSSTLSEKMRIKNNGNVGIGTSSPQQQLDISSTAPRIRFSDTSVTNLRHVIGSEANDLEIRCDDGNVQADSHIGFKIDGSEKMRIYSSGRVGIGTSSPSKTLDVAGDATISRNDTPLYLNRTGSDGEILRFSKDGTPVTSLNVESGSLSVRRPSGTNGLIQTFGQPTHGIVGAIGNTSVDFYITNNYSGSTDRAGLKLTNNNKVLPMENDASSDNVTDLGSTTLRWKDLYLGGGLYVGGTGTANKLDDYEEGTWTPTAVSTGDWSGFVSSTVTTYLAQYTKVGRKVSIQALISFPDSSTTIALAEGDSVKIGGLPFNYGGSGDGVYARIPSQIFVRDSTNGGVCHNYLFNSNQITLRVVATHGSGRRSQQSLNLSFTYFTD